MSASMYLTNLNHFPRETIISLNTTIPFSILMLVLVYFFLLHLISDTVKKTCKFFSSVLSQLFVFENSQVNATCKRDSCFEENIDSGNYLLCREEVEMVMKRLGIFCHPGGENFQESLVSSEFSNLFEEHEPSLDELKGAFDVFDENRDGYIDEMELQRVLCALGMKEGLGMENCRRMIMVFDENGDEKIDFNEFVKLMEKRFCRTILL